MEKKKEQIDKKTKKSNRKKEKMKKKYKKIDNKKNGQNVYRERYRQTEIKGKL